jgi:glutaredoxin
MRRIVASGAQKKVSVPLYFSFDPGQHYRADMKNIRLILTGLCLVFLVISAPGYAQLYKWVDDDGNVHYGDSPPEDARLEKLVGEVSSYTSVRIQEYDFNTNKTTQGNDLKHVVMFMTSWCEYCRKAASHFRRNGIPFTEYDIEKSAYAAREYRKLDGRGVPVILVGNRRMDGFRAETFDKVYSGEI